MAYERKTNCLHAFALRRALERERIWLKSEELPSFKEYYIDIGYLKKLDNNSNHLVSGRRGTGKTHLLGAFNEYINSEKPGEISLMISALDVSKSQSPISDDKNKDASQLVAQDLFAQFLKKFFDQFLQRVNEIIRAPSTIDANRINNYLEELLSEIELGSFFHVTESDSRGHNEVLITADENWNQNRFSTGSGAIIAGKDGKSGNRGRQSQGAIDYQRVRTLVERILEASKIEVLHVLIDEWMELDKNTPSRIQNYFGQFLKKTFFNSKRISVVIASIWNQTSLYERTDMEVSAGIQVGHDINHTVDLDTSLFDDADQIMQFCKELLFLRLGKKEPELAVLKDSSGAISDVFMTDIFDTLENFKVFVTASHGIPRDLMKIFQKATHRIKHDFRKYCIDYELVMQVSRDIYRQEKREFLRPNSPSHIMWSKVNRYMEDNDRRFFIIDDGSQRSSKPFRALIDHELIHEIPAPTTPRWVRRKYRAYCIDFGNYVDWKRAKSTPLNTLITETIIPRWEGVSEADADKLKIAVEPDKDQYIVCGNCHTYVERSNPVVRKFHVCNNCGHDISAQLSEFIES